MKTKKPTAKRQKHIKINGVDVPLSIFKIGTQRLTQSWVENNIVHSIASSKVPLTAMASNLAKRYSNSLTPTSGQYDWFCAILEKLRDYLPDNPFTKEWSKSELDLLEIIDKAIEKEDKSTYIKHRDELLRVRTIDEINAIITTDIRLRKHHNVQAELNVHMRKVAQNGGLTPTTVYLSREQITALEKHRSSSDYGLNSEPGDILQRLIGRLMGETALDTALAHARYNNMINLYPTYGMLGM